MFIKLRVDAAKRRDEVKRLASDSYRIAVRAKAERGEANAAALELLAKEINQPVKHLKIIRGHKTPNKIVQVLWKPR